MNKGYIKLWRKSKESSVFAHERLWKLWCLCLMKATHTNIEVPMTGILEPIRLKPGQFVTGRHALHYEYHQGNLKRKYNPKAAPTAKTLFRYLYNLQNLQMLTIKTTNKYSIITITNWSIYQEPVQQLSNSCPTAVHKQEQIKNKKDSPDIFSLRERYSDQDLIDQVFEAIASTRKSRKVKDSVLIAQLQKWEKYTVEKVEAGFRVYLDRDYAGQGKREEYLLGIIRRQENGNSKKKPASSSPRPVNKEPWY